MEDERIGSGNEFQGLVVKIKSSDQAGLVGGKVYLIPEKDLARFEFTPNEPAAFDTAAQTNNMAGLEYALFRPGVVVFGSGGG
jgi:hypothetical protein